MVSYLLFQVLEQIHYVAVELRTLQGGRRLIWAIEDAGAV